MVSSHGRVARALVENQWKYHGKKGTRDDYFRISIIICSLRFLSKSQLFLILFRESENMQSQRRRPPEAASPISMNASTTRSMRPSNRK